MASGVKHDQEKVPLHLLPPAPLIAMAEVLAFGAKKYGEWNWAKGLSYSRVFGAAMRHLWAWWLGEDNDPETGKSHLAHAGCCILFALQYHLDNRTNLDDRPKELKNVGKDESN